jgi:hypothetical protein
MLLAFATFAMSVPAWRLQAEIRIWAESPMVKVRPGDQPKQPPSQISILAARNEYEPFQVVVRSPGRALRGVDVELSDFHGSGGAKISCEHNCTIYRELYIRVTTPSGPYGSIGEWPDALIPKIDRYAGERRNAFPFDLPQDRNQPIWVEVYVPAATPPGTYTADASISAEGERTIHIPVYLTVWTFTLPSTSSIKNAFLVWGAGIRHEHNPSVTREELDQLVRTYTKALLSHRVSNGLLLGGGDWRPSELESPDAGRFARLQRTYGPFFAGTVLSNDARITAVVPQHPACVVPGQSPETHNTGPLCQADMLQALSSSGWLDRIFFYLPDEPNLADSAVLQQVQSIADRIHRIDARLRPLLTSSYSPLLQTQVDTWVVLLNNLDQSLKDGSYWSTYAPEKQRGRQVWVYQACGSHACGQFYSGFPDYPDYMIDMQGMKNRIQDWFNWRFRVDGELYWCVNHSYYRANADPFQNQFFGGGNGDGNFFYPGTPKRIGGKTDIPIESIRLKLKREGLEDYEYLTLLAQLGDSAFADSKAAQMVQSGTNWEHDPAVLYRVRTELATQIEVRMRTR